MITARRLQRDFADGFIAEAVEDLWEPWMRHADRALEDDALLLLIQQELAKRCQKSKTRGRKATPAEVVLRMLLLKHVRDWSFETLSREVRANLVYREFTRIGGEKVPVVRKNEIPLLRSLLHKAIFVMQAAEHGSLRNPVSERQHVSVLVGRDRIRHGLRQTGA
jgi:hypothetical protein